MAMPTKPKPRVANVVNSPRLPHERDEVPDASAPRKGVIVQAQRDVAAGLVDTDNYTRAPKVTQPALARRRRAR
jgi:hypothetical protein